MEYLPLYIWVMFGANVGKYTILGAYGIYVRACVPLRKQRKQFRLKCEIVSILNARQELSTHKHSAGFRKYQNTEYFFSSGKMVANLPKNYTATADGISRPSGLRHPQKKLAFKWPCIGKSPIGASLTKDE